jgi:hypothetical protein
MTISLNGEWPWYVAGPLIGLFVPALLIAGNKVFGISSNLRHLCAAIAPGKVEHFRYDWKQSGLWNLVFLSGVLIGGFLAAHTGAAHAIAISPATKALLTHQGIHDFSRRGSARTLQLARIADSCAALFRSWLAGFWWASARPTRGLHIGPRYQRIGQLSASFTDRGLRVLCRWTAGNLLHSAVCDWGTMTTTSLHEYQNAARVAHPLHAGQAICRYICCWAWPLDMF